jgi:hypothetical protein
MSDNVSQPDADLLPMPPASGQIIEVFPRQEGEGGGLGSGLGEGVGAGVGLGGPADAEVEVVGQRPAPPSMGGMGDAAPIMLPAEVEGRFASRFWERTGVLPPAPEQPATEMRAQPDPAGFDAIRSPTEPRRGTLRLSPGGTPQLPEGLPLPPVPPEPEMVGPQQPAEPIGANLLREDVTNLMLAMRQGVTSSALNMAEPVDDYEMRRRLEPAFNDDGPVAERLAAARERAAELGIEVAFRASRDGRIEAVARTPDMAAPGGAPGRVADALGRLFGLGFVDPVGGAVALGARGAAPAAGVASAGGAGPRAAARQAAPAAPAYHHDPSRISTRLPTGMRSTEDPVSGNLQIGLEAMRADPRVFEANTALVRDYPNMPARSPTSTERLAEAFIEHVRSNLLYLYDQVPQATRERSRLWYDGARAITDRWAASYGVSDRSVAAVLAALSPQKDWFQNVSLAQRVLDIYTTNGAGRAFDDAMEATARRLFTKPEYQPLVDSLRGKTFDQVTGTAERAMWLRVYDQTHIPPQYRLVTPEGGFGDVMRNADGAPSRVAWGSLTEIGKAIESLDAQGDVARITYLLGERHKVRSFYNNIVAPGSREGDVTIDTHAVAAGLLRPLSGNSLEVAHNFANYPGAGLPTAKGSSLSGVQGLYGLYAEAYRRAAADRGVLPREMQSITWEAVRGLFPDTFKTAGNMDAIDTIWREYRAGRATIDQVRSRVYERAGGIRAPDWDGSSAGGAAASRDPGDARELSGSGVRGSGARADGRAGGRASGGGAGLEPVRGAEERQPGGVAPDAPSNDRRAR